MRAPDRDVRILETRVQLRRANGWIALPYVWNAERTEAVLRRGGEFCRVRHCRTGYEMEVPTDFLFTRAGETRVTDCTDYVPAVAPGDRLAVVRRTSRGAWIKKDGVSGWYGGRLEDL